jgi:hypothetical protein
MISDTMYYVLGGGVIMLGMVGNARLDVRNGVLVGTECVCECVLWCHR